MSILFIHNYPENPGSKNKFIFDSCKIGWQGKVEYTKNTITSSEGPTMMWSFMDDHIQKMHEYERTGHSYYFVDMAYFKRMTPDMDPEDAYWKVTKNAFENYRFKERPSDRWNALDIEIHPWQTSSSDKPIIICSGSINHQIYMGDPQWEKNIVAKLKQITNREIIIRGKPGKKERDAGAPGLQELLKNAHAVVTQGSQAGAEAVIAGVPIFCHEKSHMWMMGSTNLEEIESPKMPDPRPGLYHIAYSQFNMEEMRNGYMWDILKD